MMAKQAYEKGLRRGIWLYAIWKDGQQVVGSMQRPLKEVFDDMKQIMEEYWPVDMESLS